MGEEECRRRWRMKALLRGEETRSGASASSSSAAPYHSFPPLAKTYSLRPSSSPQKGKPFRGPALRDYVSEGSARIESRKSISRKQTKKHNTTWCGAVGSAGGLGACDRLMSRPPKAREFSVFLAFSRFSAAVFFGKKLLTTDLTTYGFDRKIEYFHQSGCGAAGSARSLGVPWRYPG